MNCITYRIVDEVVLFLRFDSNVDAINIMDGFDGTQQQSLVEIQTNSVNTIDTTAEE